MKKKYTFLKTGIIILACVTSGFVLSPTHNYPIDADAELVVSEFKMRVIGNNEYHFSKAYSTFYSNGYSNITKTFNGFLSVDDRPLAYSRIDTTYKSSFDSLLMLSNNYTWEFMDLTDTNNLMRFTTTKAINRLTNVDLTTINSISKSSGFSFTHPLIQADSIVYVIGADSLTSVRKRLFSQSTGVMFTPSELNGLNNTTTGAFLMIVFNMMPQTYNGKKYYFQNNSIATVMPLPINN
ncbi:MAG TPA: hypothetical protein VN026_01075 [Bacteroidia bacterium]|jgi:hypothetical protein|nr:hypothetical protein [Bacteroidia bacterium]